MIQVTPHMRLLLAVEPVDFRKGIDGLCGLCRNVLDAEPFSGTVFVFCNKSKTAIRLLVYDGQGFWLCHKRLSQGRFQGWPKQGQRAVKTLVAHELQLLLWNANPAEAKIAPFWKPILEDVKKKDCQTGS
jgi:transposase